MQRVADENPNAQVLVRAVQFAHGATWHIANPTPVADFRWSDLRAGGETDMGHALKLVADQLKMPPMSERALPPVLVLVSDGQPTDDYRKGLDALMAESWGKKAVRIAIAIGDDADLDVLQQFIGNAERQPLQAHNAETLVRYIKWVSTQVLQAVSSPASQMQGASPLSGNVPVPQPPSSPSTMPGVADVW
jgi:uncharacterized protein YegL